MDWYSSDLFLILCAWYILSRPNLQQQFDALYQEDMPRFHGAIRNWTFSGSRPLPQDLRSQVAMRHTLGVLVEAEQDRALFERVRRILIRGIPRMQLYARNPDRPDLKRDLLEDFRQMGNHPRKSALLFPAAYLWAHTPALPSSPEFISILEHAVQSADSELVDLAEETQDGPDLSWEQLHERFPGPDALWELLRAASSPEDLYRLPVDCFSDLRSWPGPSPTSPYVHYAGTEELQQCASLQSLLQELADRAGIGLGDLLQQATLTDAEHRHLVRWAIDLGTRMPPLTLSHYMLCVCFYLVCRGEAESQALYWADRAENLASELQMLRESQTRLETRLAEALQARKAAEEAQEKARLREQELHRALERQSARANQEVLAENAALRRELARLQHLCEDRDALEAEVQGLRKLAFQEEEEDGTTVPPYDEEQLTAILARQRVVFVGGHENLRSRLRNRFPALLVLDGISSALDPRLLESAVLVALYTSHMSHKVYFRIISLLRQKGIPTSYLPAETNLDLLGHRLWSLLHQGEQTP